MIARPHGSSDQSPDGRRMGQPERNRGMRRNGASSPSGWGDGLVSLSFSKRLKLHQKNSTTRDTDTEPHPQEEQPRKQYPNQAQEGARRGQRQHGQGDDASQAHRRRGTTEKSSSASASASASGQGNRAAARISDAQIDEVLASTMMTRPSSTTRAAPKAAGTASNPTKADPPSTSPSSTTQRTTSSDRKARLAVLSSTNLNALFRTNTPTAGPEASLASSTAVSASTSARVRVRGVLERRAGDYSRFLPRQVGVRKNGLRLPPLRTARHALATQRDVSLEQRRVALHIIGGLLQPRRDVRA